MRTANYDEVNNLYKLYVMFRAPGADSRWVSAQMVMWNWFAQADKSAAPVYLLPGSEGTNPQPPARVSTPPVWNDVVQGGTFI